MRRTQQDGLLVAGVHRAIRTLRADEGPWPGVLVVDGDEHAVWCEASVRTSLPDWRMAGAEHVAGPVDIARTVDGHAILLPWCVETVSAFLARRNAEGEPLAAGEWVTLVVSLLRGLREITDRTGEEGIGCWWLTHDGRPLCVLDGDVSARDAAVALLESAVSAAPERALSRLLDTIRASLADQAPTRARVIDWERDLLAFAAPKPLHRAVGERASGDAAAGAVRSLSVVTRKAQRLRQRPSLRARALASMAALVEEVRRRFPRRRRAAAARPKRRLVVLAVVVVAAVLGAGMLWPGEPERTSAATQARTVSGVGETPAPSVTPTPSSESARATTSDAMPAVVDELLRSLGSCAEDQDAACPGVIADGASVTPDAVLRAPRSADSVIVEDYGDLAVVRIGDGTREQMLVIVRQNEKWLVRDAYDVADQPDQD